MKRKDNLYQGGTSWGTALSFSPFMKEKREKERPLKKGSYYSERELKRIPFER